MNKIRFSVLAAFLLSSQIIAEDNIELEGITVTTATRTQKSIDGVSASVEVITKEDIKKMGAQSFKDIVEHSPSFVMQYGRFPHPSSKSKSSISIRGIGANGTLILLDGKRLSGETESPYEMDRIPASMIERIEVVKGSMSTLYGSDATGGVINIITKKPQESQFASIDIRGGMNDEGDNETSSVNMSYFGKKDKLGYGFYASMQSSRPYKENENYTQSVLNPSNNDPIPTDTQFGNSGEAGVTYRDDAKVYNVGAKLSYKFSEKLKAGLDINFFKEDRKGVYLGAAKAPRAGSVPSVVLVTNTPVESVDDNRRVDGSIDLEYSISDDLSAKFRVYDSYYKKRNETTPINFTGPVNRKFSANVDITDYEATMNYAGIKEHFLTFGADYRREKRESSAINPNPSSEEFITKNINYTSLYIQDEWQIIDTLSAILGARYDDISNADSKTTLKAGLVKNISNMLNVRANYAEGYRAPDIAELYVVSPQPGKQPRYGAEVVIAGVKDAHTLKPEFVRSYEIGANGRDAKFNYDLALFFNDIEDKVELELVNNQYYTSVNKSSVETMGAELSLGYKFTPQIDTKFNWLELKTEDKATGKELLFNPRRNIAASIGYTPFSGLSTMFSVRHVGEQYISASQKADDYMICNVNVSKKVGKDIEVYGGVNNLFNEDTVKELGSNAGAFLYAGVRAQF